MKLIKKVIKSNFVKELLCKLVYVYIRFVLLTSRINTTYQGFNFEKHKNDQCILATWHGRVMIMPIINPFKLPSSAIVSDHNDGRLIGKVIEQAGVELIFGSSNRRRLSSLKEILTYIKKGFNFLITPDGPRGPNREINGAIINIASNTGLPIIPAICSAKSAKIFSSWDSFMIPYPFTEIEIIFSKPIHIPKKMNNEEKIQYTKLLRDDLNKITNLADSKVGR